MADSVTGIRGLNYGQLPNAEQKDSILAWLQQAFELSVVDLVIVAIALVPELDRRNENGINL